MRDGVSPSKVYLADQHHETLLDFFATQFPNIAKPLWQQRFAQQLVMDETGKAQSADQAYVQTRTAHSHLYYYREIQAEPRIPFEAQVLYQNERIVVADKPHWLPVTPSGRYVQETLLVRLKRQLGLPNLSPAHRLDRDTAGLVLFTTESKWRGIYQALFASRSIHKAYEAIGPYKPELERYTADAPLLYESRLEDSDTYMQMKESQGSPNAVTLLHMIERIDESLARYGLQPITGKRHQLRVHMMRLGVPICNDQIYPVLTPEKTEFSDEDYAKPLKLLAKTLAFTDPVDKEVMKFVSEIPLLWRGTP